jgi:hypothetical protein
MATQYLLSALLLLLSSVSFAAVIQLTPENFDE